MSDHPCYECLPRAQCQPGHVREIIRAEGDQFGPARRGARGAGAGGTVLWRGRHPRVADTRSGKTLGHRQRAHRDDEERMLVLGAARRYKELKLLNLAFVLG
jgi:hypothetical protein